MEKNTKTGLIIAGVILGVCAIAGIASSSSKNTTSQTTTNNYYTPSTSASKSTATTPKVETKPQAITWQCVDATSYNKNPYDDNRCTSSTGEVRYVSDSQARSLDPSYTPGTSGHPYYNSK